MTTIDHYGQGSACGFRSREPGAVDTRSKRET